MTANKAGRPREFDRDLALRAAARLFWQQGYAATSLDELLDAMRIGRSSFYGSFGSKHALLLDALTLYIQELYARMLEATRHHAAPESAVLAVLRIAACTDLPQHGCFFVNAAMELAPRDVAVMELGRGHLARVDRLVRTLLCRAGHSRADARRRSGALLALASGAIALRKAGESEARIEASLGLMPSLMTRVAGSAP